MSLEALVWAAGYEAESAVEKSILFVIASYADGDGVSFPGQQSIATKACASSRSVVRILKSLEDRGVIERRARRRGNGSRTSDEIVLVAFRAESGLDARAEPENVRYTGRNSKRSHTPQSQVTQSQVTDSHVTHSPKSPATESPPTTFEKSEEKKPLSPSASGEKEGFDLFCSVYPMARSGNVNLRVARSDWRKAVDALGPDAVLAAGRAYAAAVAKTGQLPVGLRKFLDLNPKRGLVRQWVPKEAIVLEPARLTDSEAHQFLASARESGTAERDIRRWAEPGAFRFHREGAQMVAVVPTGELEFRRAFEALIAANHLSVWSEAFLARREERRKAQGVA